MRIRPFKATLPHTELITSVDSFFATVKEDFKSYKKAGFFIHSEDDVLYVYEIVKAGHRYLGVIAANDIEDLSENKILKHEKTLAAKEQHMLRLTIERRAQIKPVLLAYPSNDDIDQFINKTIQKKADIEFAFTDKKEVHRFWEIQKKGQVSKLVDYFADISVAYIADGHHRCATTYNLNQSKEEGMHKMDIENLLVLYMSFEYLEIHDFNRIVDLTDIINPTQLMAKLSKVCKIKALPARKKPKRKHEMTTCIEGKWYRLRWKKKVLKSNKHDVVFDTALLNRLVLNEILHIKDVRSDPRIEYKSGVNGLKDTDQMIRRNMSKVAFCMFPILPSDLMQVADANKTLPPKSTWFEPRVKNGMVSIDL